MFEAPRHGPKISKVLQVEAWPDGVQRLVQGEAWPDSVHRCCFSVFTCTVGEPCLAFEVPPHGYRMTQLQPLIIDHCPGNERGPAMPKGFNDMDSWMIDR